MLKILVTEAINRRRFDRLHYVCLMVSIVCNMVFAVLSCNILYNLLIIFGSEWHNENNEYMENQVGDLFFGDKSNMVYRLIILLCIAIIIVSMILIVVFNKIWRKQLETLVNINKYIGIKENTLSLTVMFEMFLDYIVSIPFVLMISAAIWKVLSEQSIFSKINEYTDSSNRIQLTGIVVIYGITLFITTIQNGLWLRKIKRNEQKGSEMLAWMI